MTDDLQALDGVGPARSEELTDAGYATIPAVAAADANELADATSISIGTVESLIADAQSQAGSETVDATVEEDDETDETDADDDVSDDSDEADADDTDGRETREIELTDDHDLALHLLHVILEEATSQKQRSNRLMQKSTYRVAEGLAAQVGTEDAPYTVEVTQKEANALYRALTHGGEDYAGRSGIPEMYASIRSTAEAVNDVRRSF